MANENGNGKWQLAFWIMTGICVGGLLFVGNNVIANDKERVSNDQQIVKDMNDGDNRVREELMKQVATMNMSLESIKKDQQEIVKSSFVMYDKIVDRLEDIKKEVRKK